VNATAKVNRKRASQKKVPTKFAVKLRALAAEDAAWQVWNQTGDANASDQAKRETIKLQLHKPKEDDLRVNAADKIDLLEHLDWVRRIAKKCAAQHLIDGESEIDDIAGDATVILVSKHPQFAALPGTVDYSGAFRGWIYLSIKKECERSAERLLNAGTYKCRRQIPGQPLVVSIPTSLRTTLSGDQIEEESKRDLDARAPHERHRALHGTLLRRCA